MALLCLTAVYCMRTIRTTEACTSRRWKAAFVDRQLVVEPSRAIGRSKGLAAAEHINDAVQARLHNGADQNKYRMPDVPGARTLTLLGAGSTKGNR